MVARINHERAEREALEQQRLELQKRKQRLIAENKKRSDDLANLDKDLEKFIDVSWISCRASAGGHVLTKYRTGCQTYPEDVREGGLRSAQQHGVLASGTLPEDRGHGEPMRARGNLTLRNT